MKLQLKFVPMDQRKAVLYLPLDTESKEQAEQIAFDLADVTGASKLYYDPDRGGVTVYGKGEWVEVDEHNNEIIHHEYQFFVV
jgi:hypothetical protein